MDVTTCRPTERYGVGPNVLHYGPHEPEEPAFYLPVAQIPEHWTSDQVGWTRVMWFLVDYDDVALLGTFAGIALVLVAWLLSGLLAGLVVGVDGWSPVAQAVVAVLLPAAAVAASLGPALHAARVDPIISLKAD